MPQDKTIKGVMERFDNKFPSLKLLIDTVGYTEAREHIQQFYSQEIKLALESVVPEEKKLKQRETYLTLGGSLTNMYVEDDKISGYNQAINEIKENIKHYLTPPTEE